MTESRRWAATTSGNDASALRPPRSLLWGLAPGAMWWVANIGFYTLGLLDTGEVGYRAWLAGLSGFPRWFQSVFARCSPLCWITSIVLLGAWATIRGPRVVRSAVVFLVVMTVGTMVLVVAATAVWPDAHR